MPMQRASATRFFRGLSALLLLGILCSVPLAVISYVGYLEHVRRIEILTTGESATARVTESYSGISSRGCAFKYQFLFAGNLYTGGEGGCGLVKSHPVGSVVTVRFARGFPENSLAEGADLWPGWIVVPILIGLSLLLLGAVVAYAMFEGVSRPRSQRKPAH